MKIIYLGLIPALLALGGCANSSSPTQEAKEKEEHEVKVAMQDVPPAVQSTLKREANGQTISTVDKEQRRGKTVYEADAKIDGSNYEIVVAENGQLISKKLDNEENEKAEKHAAHNEKED